MKITKLKISNYRLLKNLELDLEDDLSLIIGKNNCGKTSLLSIMNSFLGDKPSSPIFAYEDFNIEFQEDLEKKVTGIIETEEFTNLGISMKLFIQYGESDSLANINKLMLDLEPENNFVVLLFEYVLRNEDYLKIRLGFREFKENISRKKKEIEKNTGEKPKEEDDKTLFNQFIKRHYQTYFKSIKKAIRFDHINKQENESEFIDISTEKKLLKSIINFRIIPANRDISNKNTDNCLSVLASSYYKKKEETNESAEEIEEFKDVLGKTDIFLDGVYQKLFSRIIEKVKLFGGVKEGESIINIISTLQHQNLLEDNTTVTYKHNEDCFLPENYNGLGYLNLICMIFDIELIINDFRKNNKPNESPADINLLFLEEPEAHTHPQMQYIFIKNIKKLLLEASKGQDRKDEDSLQGFLPFNLQTLITSHSSHIISECDFDDIKYFQRTKNNEIQAKNLKELQQAYSENKEKQYFKFLKQYLTLNKSELFFADKAIFIEGDTERILLPAMMIKIDQENKEDNLLPLCSQNISIIEVGNYSHVFEKFFDFIGLKSLIITDFDSSSKQRGGACKVSDVEALYTTNHSLRSFFACHFCNEEKTQIEILKDLSFENKILRKNPETLKWEVCEDGCLALVYQIEERCLAGEVFTGRSFEDAFIHINRTFIKDHLSAFESLNHIELFDDSEKDAYDIAEECVTKKTSFAMEILLNSETDDKGNKFSNWQVPLYIKEGLLWLKKN